MSHHLDDNFLKKHKRETLADGTGGACLNRHEKRQPNNSCSHIWQAYEKAKAEDPVPMQGVMYNWPKYDSLVGRQYNSGSRWSKKMQDWFPKGLGPPDPMGPSAGDWDLTHADNFQSWIKPYWHNAHHIVPNRVLTNVLLKTADKNQSLYLLLRSGLLGAKYNLNFRVNMIILPMARDVAHALGLPRHLLGAEEPRSHQNYSDLVEARIESCMNDYLQILEGSDKNHPAPPNELSKQKLEKTSEDVYKRIKGFGAAQPGEALARMTSADIGTASR